MGAGEETTMARCITHLVLGMATRSRHHPTTAVNEAKRVRDETTLRSHRSCVERKLLAREQARVKAPQSLRGMLVDVTLQSPNNPGQPSQGGSKLPLTKVNTDGEEVGASCVPAAVRKTHQPQQQKQQTAPAKPVHTLSVSTHNGEMWDHHDLVEG
jgi:hypothetical protein